MFSARIHSSIHFILSALIAFLLPFKQIGPLQIVAAGIGLLFLNWLLEGRFISKFSAIRYPFIFFTYIGFYMYHLVGMLWTNNMTAGWFDLEVKLSLFVIPLIYATRPFEAKELNRILGFFVLGCSLAALVVLIRAGYFALVFGQNKFYYTQLSWFVHPSYFAMYLNLSLIILILAFTRTGDKPGRIWLLLLPLHLLVIILLASKIGLISLVLLIICLVLWIIIRKKKILIGAGLVVLLFCGGGAIVHFSPSISGRLYNAFHAVTTTKTDKRNAESTAVRMLIWKSASELIAEHPLAGSGTGDSKDMLMQKYKAEGVEGAYEHNLNAHNAYLQEGVALGLGGLLLLIGIQVLPFLSGWKDNNVLLCCFILLTVVNFLPESMLETQAGCMYYGFFNSLLLFSSRPGLLLSRPLKTLILKNESV
ncbi:MAG: O-antigen ligase family protein [Bacteroidia bacterium]